MARATGAARAGLFQFISIARPIFSLVRGSLAEINPIAAGILMVVSAAIMMLICGFNLFAAIPQSVSAVAGGLALASAGAQRFNFRSADHSRNAGVLKAAYTRRMFVCAPNLKA
jgi:hypothetical protein